MRNISIILLLLCLNIGLPSVSEEADSLSKVQSPASPDWVYWRHYELYVQLIRFADLSEEQRSFYRHAAYQFFFRYWILHRSEHAQLAPTENFEKQFAVLLKNHVLPFVEADDPIQIKSHYKDGQFVPKPLPQIEGVELKVPESARLPQVEGLPKAHLKTWDRYQAYVIDFRKFLDTKAAQRLDELRLTRPSVTQTNLSK